MDQQVLRGIKKRRVQVLRMESGGGLRGLWRCKSNGEWRRNMWSSKIYEEWKGEGECGPASSKKSGVKKRSVDWEDLEKMERRRSVWTSKWKGVGKWSSPIWNGAVAILLTTPFWSLSFEESLPKPLFRGPPSEAFFWRAPSETSFWDLLPAEATLWRPPRAPSLWAPH